MAQPAWEPDGSQTAVHPQLLRALRGGGGGGGVGTVPVFVPQLGAPLEAEELMSSSSSFGRL